MHRARGVADRRSDGLAAPPAHEQREEGKGVGVLRVREVADRPEVLAQVAILRVPDDPDNPVGGIRVAWTDVDVELATDWIRGLKKRLTERLVDDRDSWGVEGIAVIEERPATSSICNVSKYAVRRC